MSENKKINCNVESCKYQNNNKCNLKEILVGNCGVHKANNSVETFCVSFECNSKNKGNDR